MATHTETEKCLYAYYDFQVAPVSFNFAAFLVLARLKASRERCDRIHIVFVPGPKDGFRDDDAAYDLIEKQQRLQCILLPMTAMLDVPVSLSLCQRREEAEKISHTADGPVFPEGYSVAAPTSSFLLSGIIAAHVTGAAIPSLRAPEPDRRTAKAWLDRHGTEKLPVVITLREATHSPKRNSNINAWASFANRLDHDRFIPIVVRDTGQVSAPLPPAFHGVLTCPVASFDLNFRLALYELAYINLLIPNGPAVLCWLNNRIRFIMFSMLNDGATETRAHVHTSMGLRIGGQYPPATAFQKLVWEPDTEEIIEREFAAMTDRIDSTPDGDVTATDPSNSDEPMAVAVRLQANGRLDDAAAIYQHILTHDPNDADAWHLLGIIAYQAGQSSTAEGMMRRAISIKPDQANFHIDLATVLRSAARPEDAKDCIWRALALAPDDAGAHADLAELLQTAGDQEEAKSELLEAIRLNPNSPALSERIAGMLHSLGHSDMAATLFRKAADLRKANIERVRLGTS